MCRIINRRRLEYYTSVRYDKRPLFAAGDVVWVYASPPATDAWLVYEAKVIKLRSLSSRYRDEQLKLEAYLPAYEVQLPWSLEPSLHATDTFFENHMYNRQRLTAEEMLCIIGENNQTVLRDLSDTKRRKVPRDGLVFLGTSQMAALRDYVAKSGGMTESEHTGCCDSDPEFDCDIEEEEEENRTLDLDRIRSRAKSLPTPKSLAAASTNKKRPKDRPTMYICPYCRNYTKQCYGVVLRHMRGQYSAKCPAQPARANKKDVPEKL
ncbi:uncharacterized protein LOC129598797 [Paramacrobiotus metropolitanus]|uniref:uncharacterized protein LOC129598797 n=1 Tax=Paramacrobiotus metropolitanus TaxID=2943436 RepID=UPI00244648FF|nr:uncharacterized protein LOC129598797 [Paramacrobiotus metropolitanus]